METFENNNPEIRIREFCMVDYEAVISLWRNAKLPHKPAGRDRKDKVEKEILRENAIFLVAELKGEIIGSIFGTHDGRKGWVNRLAVAPKLRNLGIARKLVAAVEDKLSKLGIDIICCLIEDWNTESLEIFKRLGYHQHSDIIYFSKRKHKDV